MTEFKGVTVVKKANIYFNGNVASRSVIFPDGSRKTLGIMLPGEYEFTTDAREIMEIMSGELDVLLPGQVEWKTIQGGESFEVPAKSAFGLKVKKITDYCCSFVASSLPIQSSSNNIRI
ncbi:MAG: pyrimidine/purine nucleoside phosphorylase [Thermodesulfobacteriota bacterium]